MYFVFAIAVVGALLGVWYFNYFRQMKAAGGAQGLMDQQMRQEFGLAEGERVTKWFAGVCYLGALRPGGGAPTLGDRFGNALDTHGKRGAQVHLCITDRGRLGVSMEPLDGLGRTAAIAGANLGSTQAFYQPFALVGQGGARLMTFDEAFPGLAYPKSDAPSLRGHAGVVPFELVHWWGADGQGVSLWVDPAFVPEARALLAGTGAAAA